MVQIVLSFMLAFLVLGAMPLPAPNTFEAAQSVDAAAKQKSNKDRKRKKPSKPRAKTITRAGCKIREKGSSWTLLQDCTPTGTINLPKNIVFNGQNRTITVTGSVTKFREAVLYADYVPVSVKNLTMIGSEIQGSCITRELSAIDIRMSSGAKNVAIVDSVTITDVQAYGSCGDAISVEGGGKVKVTNSTISVDGPNGIFATGEVVELLGNTVDVKRSSDAYGLYSYGARSAFVARNNRVDIGNDGHGILLYEAENIVVDANTIIGNGTVDGYRVGISTSDPALSFIIVNNRIESLYIAVEVSGRAVASLTENELVDVNIGISAYSQANVSANGNEITGRGQDDYGDGAYFRDGAKGSLTSNSISQFECGVDISEDAGAVTESGNTFTDNETDVCDETP